MDSITISAVAFEESGVWVVQGIEYDICTHAKDAQGIPDAFMRAVAENVCISTHLGKVAFAGIKPAPARFKEMYERAGTEVNTVRDWTGARVPLPSMNIRLAEHA